MAYLEVAGHCEDDAGALFRPLCNNMTGKLGQSDHAGRAPTSWCMLIRPPLGFQIGATKVQEWLDHANIAATRICDHGRTPRRLT